MPDIVAAGTASVDMAGVCSLIDIAPTRCDRARESFGDNDFSARHQLLSWLIAACTRASISSRGSPGGIGSPKRTVMVPCRFHRRW